MKDVLRLVREQKFSFSTLYIILTKNRYTIYFINALIIARQKFLGPFKYDKYKYADTFLVNTATPLKTPTTTKVERVIYCFWTGDNEMSENRKNAIRSLQETSGVPVKIITQHDLSNYIVPDYPLHVAYEQLSFVHKSDYLRCYFMLHYGGGYSDVKKTHHNWNPFFDAIDNASDKQVLGFTELSYTDTGYANGFLQKDLRLNYLTLIGTNAYIFKPYSQFATEWYAELHKRMDALQDALAQNPGNDRGTNTGYPVRWTYVLGDIFHPLCLKYHKDIIHDNRIKPDMTNYK